ncbi:MAG: pyridoxal-phosphate dependent enzyme [Phycisphaerales bacterium JB043]
MKVTFEDIQQAAARLDGAGLRTPCILSDTLSELTGAQVFLKLENLQRTGSFKERGARNALLQLDEAQRATGVVAASAGNHALGLAFHGRSLDVPVTVVMPASAPLIKQARCRRLGARVLTIGETFQDAYEKAQQLVDEEGLHYVHGYDAPEIIAGQGTMGLEIIDQLKRRYDATPDILIVPVGGGGLLAGLTICMRHAMPDSQIFGVEPERAATYHAAREQGRPVFVPVGRTIADGLATPDVGANAFENTRDKIAGMLLVDEAAISIAVLRLLEYEKLVVEGAGAAGLAAIIADHDAGLLSGTLPELAGKNVVLPICGGNIDPTILQRVIERGLAIDGRLMRFTTTISDKPGGLRKLAEAISDAGASVVDILHDRAFASADLSSVDVRCIVETNSQEHARQLVELLTQSGFHVKVEPSGVRTTPHFVG